MEDRFGMKNKNRKMQFIVIIILIISLLLLSVCIAIYAAGDDEPLFLPPASEETQSFLGQEPVEPVSEIMTQVSETEYTTQTQLQEETQPQTGSESEIQSHENMTQVSEIKNPETYFTTSPITDELYERINGCSYVENDDIALEDLRYLQVLHIGFDGETHVGELIVNAAIAEDILAIMRELYKNQYPIERMKLVDEYGGDDELSMQANNTSCFNYRTVEGSDNLSKHSFGLAIDINPFYNPCVRSYADGSTKSFPEGSDEYADRSKEFPYKIDKEDLCYRLFMEHGFRWGGTWKSLKDYQHFDKAVP